MGGGGDMTWLKSASFSSSDDFASDRGGREVDVSFSMPPVLSSTADFTALLTAQSATVPVSISTAPPTVLPSTARNREFRFYNLEPDGALRRGGARPLWTRRSVGLLITYAVVGALYGVLPALVSPFFREFLDVPGPQVQAARRVLDAPWLWKTAGGALSDALPVRGLRRKPYMVLGWAVAFSALAFLGLVAAPDPATPASSSGSGGPPPDDTTNQDIGWLYISVMGVATIGALVANVAADGLMIEWAQREPLATRGRTQTAVFATRCLFMFVADFLVDTLVNSARFGGDYSWDIGVNALFLSLAVLSLAALAGSVWLLEEDKVAVPGYCGDDSAGAATTTTAESTPGPIHEYELYGNGDDDDAVLHDASLTPRRRQLLVISRHQLWRLSQSRAVWTLLLFVFLSTLLFAVTPMSATAFMTRWYVIVDPDARTAADLVKGLIYTLALIATQRFLQSTSWPTVFVCATVWVVVVRVVVAAVSVFNIVRSPWFLLYGAGLLATPASAARALVTLLPIAETAPHGLEATTYGLVITFFNFGLLLADVSARWLGGQFGVADIDAEDADTLSARWTVMWAFLAAFAVQLSSLGAGMFLPRQRLEVQQLRYYGGYSVGAAGVVAVGVALALTYSVMTIAFASMHETACLRIAGGNGC